MQPWQIFFSGRFDPESKLMAYGWGIIRVDTGEMETGGNVVDSRMLNNTADIAAYIGLYRALMRMIEWRKDAPKYGGVVVAGDNEAVVNQIAERWTVEGERASKAHAQCLELLTGPLSPYSTEVRTEATNTLARTQCDKAWESWTKLRKVV